MLGRMIGMNRRGESETGPVESELVARMRLGEQQAFDQFFATYAPRLARFAARRSLLDETALEDVVLATMTNAMRSLRHFRGQSSLFTWLCQICRNQLTDLHRREARHSVVVSLEKPGTAESRDAIARLSAASNPQEECEQDSTRAAVRRVVCRLSSSHARVLELRFGDDLSVSDIARRLGLSVSAAESRLLRARQAFHKAWNEGLAVTSGPGRESRTGVSCPRR